MIPSHSPDSRARADELGESREIRLSVPTKLNAPPVFTSSNELRVIGRAQRVGLCGREGTCWSVVP